MTMYAVSDQWERNGYHDSDWYVVSFDDETKKLNKFLTGSTRFAGGFQSLPKAPPEIIFEAKEILIRDIIIPRLTNSYAKPHPNDEFYPLRNGETIEFVKNATIAHRKECKKCSTSGKWINPKNSNDIRECLSCSGIGYWPYPDKDIPKARVKRGDHGEVIRVEYVEDRFKRASFGKYYAWINCDSSNIRPVRVLISYLTRPTYQDTYRKIEENAGAIAVRSSFSRFF